MKHYWDISSGSFLHEIKHWGSKLWQQMQVLILSPMSSESPKPFWVCWIMPYYGVSVIALTLYGMLWCNEFCDISGFTSNPIWYTGTFSAESSCICQRTCLVLLAVLSEGFYMWSLQQSQSYLSLWHGIHIQGK